MRAIRALLLLVVIAVVIFAAYSYWGGTLPHSRANAIGTSGNIDVNAARERGAEVGEKLAVAAQKAKESAAEAAVTSKIKAKMVLDDTIKARAIDVSTTGSVVTLSGTVQSATEHDRAISLARETAGVTRVVDRLTVARN